MLITSENKFFEYETIGRFCSADKWIHPARIIDTFEIIFVTEGTVFINENEIEYTLTSGDCLILEPGVAHCGRRYSENPTSFYWLHFKTDMDIPFKIRKCGEDYDVKYLLKKLIHMSKTEVFDRNALDAAALLIFRELAASDSSEKNSLAYKIAEYIRINAEYGITAAETGMHFGYNADYISKLFKKSFHMGIKEYISSERMKYARDLLLNTDMSVKEIAAHMRFGGENSFIKFFTYHAGISPARLRNKYFNLHMNNK